MLRGFDDPLQAGDGEDERAMVCTLTRSVWTKLETMAGDVEQVKQELRSMNAADIFDVSGAV